MTTTTVKSCAVAGCHTPAKSRGHCGLHYDRMRARMVAYGRWTTSRVPAEPTRHHLQDLADAGMSLSQVHRETGVALSNLCRIIDGRARQVTAGTSYKIGAVPIPAGAWWEQAASKSVGDRVGTTRRLQALVALGYQQGDLAERLGKSITNISPFFHGQKPVSASMARRVAALYNELSMTPGPSNLARSRGNRMGWLLPLDWDDHTIDNPDAMPALDPDNSDDRKRLSRWWRNLPCAADECPNTRKGLGQQMCHSHVLFAARAEKKEKAVG